MTLHLFRMQQIVSVFRTHFYSKFTKYTAGQIVKYKLNNKKKKKFLLQNYIYIPERSTPIVAIV